MRKISLFLLIISLFFLTAFSCEDLLDSSFTYTGTLNKIGADGLTAYAKFVAADGDCGDPAIYSTSTTFSGNVATFIIKDIDEGDYVGCIMIDWNNDADSSNPEPNSTDYTATSDGNVTIDSDDTLIINEGDWTIYP